MKKNISREQKSDSKPQRNERGAAKKKFFKAKVKREEPADKVPEGAAGSESDFDTKFGNKDKGQFVKRKYSSVNGRTSRGSYADKQPGKFAPADKPLPFQKYRPTNFHPDSRALRENKRAGSDPRSFGERNRVSTMAVNNRSTKEGRTDDRERPAFNAERPVRNDRPAYGDRPTYGNRHPVPTYTERPIREPRLGRNERPANATGATRTTRQSSAWADRSSSRGDNSAGSIASESRKIGRAAQDETRLNKYIANAGICARRKADEMIAQGLIRVNGKVITEMGFKVRAGDHVKYMDKNLGAEEMVYVLLNKPKDYITTTEDPQERKTVMELVKSASDHRIYPVGRLDRNTSGLLLFTNDGALAEKLSHPAGGVSKLYHVTLDKNLTNHDFETIAEGVELEDGKIMIDEISFVEGESHKEVGIQIHSGKNRVVRRIFEKMGYEVIKLDRVLYAGLTKKDLSRGRWRFLTPKEVIQLKHFLH